MQILVVTKTACLLWLALLCFSLPPPPKVEDLFSFREGSAYNQLIRWNLAPWPSLTTELNCSRSVVRRGLNVVLFLLSPFGIWSLKIKSGIFFPFKKKNASCSSTQILLLKCSEKSAPRDAAFTKYFSWIHHISLNVTCRLRFYLPPPSPHPPVGYGNGRFHVLSCDWKENEQKCKAWLMKQEQAEGDLSSSEIQSLSKSPNME